MADLIDRQKIKARFEPWLKVKGYSEGEINMLKAVLYEITIMPSAQPEQRWIPCSERLPKQGQEVICQCRASIITVLKLDANGDWYQDVNHCYMGGFVIAWMPLPEPYEDGEQDG